MLKNILISVGSSIVVVIIGLLLFGGNTNFAGITHLSGLQVGTDGLSTTGTFSATGASTLTGATTVTGQVTTNGGLLRSNSLSSSTVATTATLTVSDIRNYDTLLMTPNGATLTLTFPASSTLSTLVPTAGDRQDWCVVNSTTTASATITFAASTGIDLETSSTTKTDLTVAGGDSACFKIIRQKATATAFDISVLMTEYANAD